VPSTVRRERPFARPATRTTEPRAATDRRAQAPKRRNRTPVPMERVRQGQRIRVKPVAAAGRCVPPARPLRLRRTSRYLGARRTACIAVASRSRSPW
jgi:hypothetical protein